MSGKFSRLSWNEDVIVPSSIEKSYRKYFYATAWAKRQYYATEEMHDSPSYPESYRLRNSTKKRAFSSFILYLVHWARWLHVGSIISVKRELTAIASGSRPRRFLTTKTFSWTTAGVDSDILDSQIRCRNARDDSIFRRNVIRSLREKACKRCLDFKFSGKKLYTR